MRDLNRTFIQRSSLFTEITWFVNSWTQPFCANSVPSRKGWGRFGNPHKIRFRNWVGCNTSLETWRTAWAWKQIIKTSSILCLHNSKWRTMCKQIRDRYQLYRGFLCWRWKRWKRHMSWRLWRSFCSRWKKRKGLQMGGYWNWQLEPGVCTKEPICILHKGVSIHWLDKEYY